MSAPTRVVHNRCTALCCSALQASSPAHRLHCLQDTRSLDGKMNLLLYIAQQLSARQPPHAILAEEVPHVMGTGIKTTLQVSPSQTQQCVFCSSAFRAGPDLGSQK